MKKDIFHHLHSKQDFNRLTSLLTADYLGVRKDFFRNKVCLDAGCGANANAAYAMLKMGAQKVYVFDVNPKIRKTVPSRLRQFKGRYELAVADVANIPYPDNFFDFTHCAGMLHHIPNARKGIKELARVTKKTLYVAVDGSGGIMTEIKDLLREKYKKDKVFKRFIDTWGVLDMIQWACDSLGIVMDRTLFDKELMLTVQDRLIPSVHKRYTEKEIRSWLQESGFSRIARLTRQPEFSNIRKFLSPFYGNYKHPYARLLYGEGVIQLKAQKSELTKEKRK